MTDTKKADKPAADNKEADKKKDKIEGLPEEELVSNSAHSLKV